jgi:hypothetical protein
MTVEKQTLSLDASYFTSMSTLRRITHNLSTPIRRFKIQRRERRSATSNTIKRILQMICTINLGAPPKIKPKYHKKTIKFLDPT